MTNGKLDVVIRLFLFSSGSCNNSLFTGMIGVYFYSELYCNILVDVGGSVTVVILSQSL